MFVCIPNHYNTLSHIRQGNKSIILSSWCSLSSKDSQGKGNQPHPPENLNPLKAITNPPGIVGACMDRLSLAVSDRLLPDYRVAPASHGRVRLSVAPRVVISTPNPGKGAATMMSVGEI